MPKKSLVAVVVLILVALSAGAGETRPPLPTARPNLKPKICAHRGVKRIAPENTIPAYQKAIEMGYDYVEVDVRFARDGVPVLMHDDWILRVTGMPYPPSHYDLADLKRLLVMPGKGLKYWDTRIATLEEALQLMQGKVKLYLDQKEMPTEAEFELLKKYGFYPDNIVIAGEGPAQQKFREWDRMLPAMPHAYKPDDLPNLMEEWPGMIAINTQCATITAELIDAAHAAGLLVFTNVVNKSWYEEEACMRRPIELGSDVIQLDNPVMFKKLIEEYQAK